MVGVVRRALTVACAVALVASHAAAQVYQSSQTLVIPASGTPSQFPSSITVTGGPESVRGLTVTLRGLSTTSSFVLNALLVSPSGEAAMLLFANGNAASVNNLNLALTTAPGAPSLPGVNVPLASGTFAFNNDLTRPLSPPAPQPPYTGVSSFAGIDANGTWSLYIQNVPNGGAGQLANGWSIEFHDVGFPITPSKPFEFTYQGLLTGGPTTGSIDVGFSLWDHPVSESQVNFRQSAIPVTDVPLNNGQFTTTARFQFPVPTDRDVWLEVSVANPTGTGFVTLLPRQRIAFTPLAASANTANVATTAGTALRMVATGNSGLSDTELRLRAVNDGNHGLAYFGDGSAFRNTGFLPNGPVLWGAAGGGLGTSLSGVGNIALSWNSVGHVGIGTPASNSFRLELPNVAAASGQGRANAWVTYSSRDFKDQIETIPDALRTLAHLRGVRFVWKDPLPDGTHKHDIGFIAEEVASAVPDLVETTPDGHAAGLDYGKVVPITVEAIKQQQRQLEALSAENADLRARLERLESLVASPAAPASPR